MLKVYSITVLRTANEPEDRVAENVMVPAVDTTDLVNTALASLILLKTTLIRRCAAEG
jgi:hypothetical protein